MLAVRVHFGIYMMQFMARMLQWDLLLFIYIYVYARTRASTTQLRQIKQYVRERCANVFVVCVCVCARRFYCHSVKSEKRKVFWKIPRLIHSVYFDSMA